jgi:hypothetical protein
MALTLEEKNRLAFAREKRRIMAEAATDLHYALGRLKGMRLYIRKNPMKQSKLYLVTDYCGDRIRCRDDNGKERWFELGYICSIQ